jgi:hypothetical protein
MIPETYFLMAGEHGFTKIISSQNFSFSSPVQHWVTELLNRIGMLNVANLGGCPNILAPSLAPANQTCR